MLFLLVMALLGHNAGALPSEPYILFSNITAIHTLDLTSLARVKVLDGLDYAVPLGIDSKNSHMYFGEHRLGRIYRSSYDGSSKTLIMEDAKNVEGVAIDWIGRKLYWTTYESETIEVSTLDGKFRKVLINAGVEYPRGLAVDPIAGYLFWSDWGASAAIERCALDGSDRKALVKNNITWPNGVTIDYAKKYVYWIDSFHNTVSRVDYDGNNRQLIFQDTSLAVSKYHGFDLDIIGDSLYWTDWVANSIYGVTISTGVMFRNVSIPTSKSIKGAMGLRIVESSRQPSGSSNCGQNNGDCEQLCFHKVPSTFSCACQLGMRLKDDGKSCEDALKDEFLMFADSSAGKIYQLPLDSINEKPLALPLDETVNISSPVALEYDRVEDRVYWSDVSLNTISRVFRNGTGYELLFDGIGSADGLTLDLAGRKIYWTDTASNTIQTSLFNGLYRKVLVRRHLDQPRDIIIDAIEGFMYWTDWGTFPRIERAYTNGEYRETLVNRTIRWPNGLTIDHVYNKLYWADASEDNIEVMNLGTKERKVVLNKKILLFTFLYPLLSQVNHPYGLTLLRDKFYWTDWQTESVYRADINTGANIILMAGNLGRPMDIHAYSAIPKNYTRIEYMFTFPFTNASTFACHLGLSCPPMADPPECPPGFTSVRVNETCGLNCRDIVGYTYRCPCRDWMSCAVKEEYLAGCIAGAYASFRVRECSQVVRPGRCPTNTTSGSQTACVNDEACPGTEKCCNKTCTTPASIETHPCQKNNGGCDQLCFPVPGGSKCGCGNGFLYDENLKQCVIDTRTTTPAPPTPTSPSGCKPHPAPGNGSVDCDGDPVPEGGQCRFKCDDGFEMVGYNWDICYFAEWLDPTPTCVEDSKPKFSYCLNNTVLPTDRGKSYRLWNWSVPTATDHKGADLTVSINKPEFLPPVKVEIGGPELIVLSATDTYSATALCSFTITIEDQEPPSFGSTCPKNITKYQDNNQDAFVPLALAPRATDNSGKSPVIFSVNYPHNLHFPVGRTLVQFHARDGANLTAQCVYTVTVVNVCANVTCGQGAKCMLDNNQHSCVCNTLCPQITQPVCGSNGKTYNSECLMELDACLLNQQITVASQGACAGVETCDNLACEYGAVCQVSSGKAECRCDTVCAENYDPVCGSDLKTYSNECNMRSASCTGKKNITLLRKGKCGDCSSLTCGFGAQCEVVGGLATCECDLKCADEKTPVCGSDGITYEHKCAMLKAQCRMQKQISKVTDGACDKISGCGNDLATSDAYKQTSNIVCKNDADSFSCSISCQVDHNAVFAHVLKIQCYKKTTWIRRNLIGKYVPIGSTRQPPQCYKERAKSALGCPSTTTMVGNVCVPCPPGSYYESSSKLCKECDVTTYQDRAQQTSCKQCSGTSTSTTSGAENCFFNYASNVVRLEFEENESTEITKQKLRQEIAAGLTKICRTTTCTFVNNDSVGRKRRASDTYEFKEEHVILVGEIKQSSNGGKEVMLFVLDPTSVSLLPDRAFSSEQLRALLLKIKSESAIGIVLKQVVTGTAEPSASSSDGGSSSIAPGIAGGIIAVLVLVGLVFALWMYSRRRRNKRNDVPPVQFNSAGNEMQIGSPEAVSSRIYDTPDNTSGQTLGFENQVYMEENAPPPYYEVSPVRKPSGKYVAPSHVYETPDEQADALPTKDQLPDGAVVDMRTPPKDGVDYGKHAKADPPVKFFHKRGAPNVYESSIIPAHRSGTADAEAEMKLDPPPKFDDAKLQVLREKTASAMLPNVPRKKKPESLDRNANEASGSQSRSSNFQNLDDVTKNQSES